MTFLLVVAVVAGLGLTLLTLFRLPVSEARQLVMTGWFCIFMVILLRFVLVPTLFAPSDGTVEPSPLANAGVEMASAAITLVLAAICGIQAAALIYTWASRRIAEAGAPA